MQPYSKLIKEREVDNITLNEAFEKSLTELQNQKPTNVLDESAKLDEEQIEINEAGSIGATVTLVISTLLAAPTVMKSLVQAVDFVVKKINKLMGGEGEDSKLAEKLIRMADKWHHAYIKSIEQVLKIGGIFKKADMAKDEEKREKAAEVVFYTIIFGLAIYGGILTVKGAMGMINNMQLEKIKVVTLEGVLSAIKSREVQQFIGQLKSEI